MSRIGKKPIPIPKGVEVKIEGNHVEVRGPKGKLERTLHPLVRIERDGDELKVSPVNDSRQARALWGLSRTLVNNMVIGVTEGYKKVLEIEGMGYRAELAGRELKLTLGFSHPVIFPLPEGIDASVEKNTVITISGIDKELVGQTAATIRRFRPPEPYKGKGIRYRGEVIRRKAGKAGIK